MSASRHGGSPTAGRLALFLILTVLIGVGTAGPAAAKPSEEPFEIVPGSFHFTPSNFRAGAHADWVTTFDFAHNQAGETHNDVRTTIVNLPAGFDANNTAVPTCSSAQLLGAAGEEGNLPECPIASQVGKISINIVGSVHGHAQDSFPVYNMEVTSFGVPAELGFKVGTLLTQVVPISVRPGDEGLTAVSPNIAKTGEVRNITFTVWGLPASHEHDAERGEVCAPLENFPSGECTNEFGGPQEAHIPVKPFLSNPTSCGMFSASMSSNSWEEPLSFPGASDQVGPVVECERVPFDPSIEVQPSTRFAESPTGLDVSLVVPQAWDNPYTISTANLKDAKVTLPAGFTVNPSAGSGLGACTPAEYAAETAESLPGEGCPPESKIGSIVIETPLLAETIPGAIYIATPYDNPFGEPDHPGGTLLALYVVAKDPARGIIVKVAGKIEPNPVTGQLVTTFLNNPQQPFSKFTLKFRPGATAPLVTPPACGTYTTQAELTPWSAPGEPRFVGSSFQIEGGIAGGSCPSGGIPPFKPGILAGTLNNSAGSYSPMSIHITRNDGEQEITRFTSILPPGLTANLTGIPFCPDADIEAAKRVTGAQEEAEPSCPASSEIGHSLVGAGVGSVLAWTPGKVYMAGPYNGAPFSIAAITSAKVGPFDLGTVVVREALVINPETGIVTVDAKASDPIPHIIDGIVIHVRDIRVYIDRPNFMINPTSCNPMSFAATVGGGGANPANPADQQLATVTNSFQMANCQNLAFKPSFKVSTSGKTSRANGASLNVKVSYPPGSLGSQTNLRSVKVDLPRQLPSRLTTLQKACPHAAFEANPASCPPESVVGHAVVHTQLIPVPLTGPAYFVSYGGEEFPKLIIVLQGYGVTIDLVGNTFIKHGVTSSTFRSTPDTPFESFELTFPEGKFSALAANGNLCTAGKTITVSKRVKRRVHGRLKTVTVKVKKKGPGLVMPIALTGQNGAVIHQNTPVSVTGCPKAHKKAKHKKGKKKKR